jgi:hypothetical protein
MDVIKDVDVSDIPDLVTVIEEWKEKRKNKVQNL